MMLRRMIAAVLLLGATTAATWGSTFWDGTWGGPTNRVTIVGQSVRYLILGQSGDGTNVQVTDDTVSFEAGQTQVTMDRVNDHVIALNLMYSSHARTLRLCRIQAKSPNGRTAGGPTTCP